VVEDDPAILNSTQECLESLGYKTLLALDVTSQKVVGRSSERLLADRRK
jgi:CheY-like chemotaxis protein